MFYRFEDDILQYGFYMDNFRVIVKDEKYSDIKSALYAKKPNDFPGIVIMRQDEIKEEFEAYCGGNRAQGRRLYPAGNEENYGTLGCLAILNNETTVVLSSYHVCMDETVCSRSIYGEELVLGESLFVIRNDDHEINNNLAIVKLNPNMITFFQEKKLLNSNNVPTKAKMSEVDTMSLKDEIVHKLGAESDWTQGRIIGTEIVSRTHGIITIEGMNGDIFGRPGDSGSIVFRETFVGKEETLDILGILYGENKSNNFIVCSTLKDALDYLKDSNEHIKTIKFFKR